MNEFITRLPEFAANHPLLVFSWLLIVIALLAITIRTSTGGIKDLGNDQATIMLNQEDAIALDVRPLAEFKTGHILNSKHILAADIKNKDIGSIEKYKDRPVIVICKSGITSLTAAKQLHKQGFTNLSYLKHGLAGWNNAHLPLSKS